MLDVFLCHSPSDSAIAERIAARLERCAEANVWAEPLDAGSFVTGEWDAGLSSAGIVLLLGPDAVPSRVRREEWQAILTHTATHAQPPIACVLTADCAYPRLLERKNFFQWSDDVARLRALERWVVGLHEPSGAQSFAAAPLFWFENRAAEMDKLWRTLVDDAGQLCTLSGREGSGKTALAQEFARVAGEQFREVLWVSCGDSSDASIVGDLGAQLGIVDARSIPDVLKEHRLLVIFDDVRRCLPVRLDDVRGRSSVLLTTRNEEVRVGVIVPVDGVGFALVPEPMIDGTSLQLWKALSVCRRDTASVALASKIAGLQAIESDAALKRLLDARVVDPLDASRVRVRRSAVPEETLRHRHAETVHASLPECFAEVPSALEYACRRDWDLAQRLGQHAADTLRLRYRNAEAAELLDRLVSAAEHVGRVEAAQHFRWELSWIREDGGQVQQPIHAELQVQLRLAL